MSPQMEIQIIAVLVASACSIIGVFLVLRRMALISDAISHSILLGIVLGFFLAKDLSSPLLIIIAGITGVITVVLVELLHKTNLMNEDAAMGIVFPALFSVGVILVSKNVADIHLDIDAVLVGELAFAPFNRMVVLGFDLGAKGIWVMGGILAINFTFMIMLFKELKLSTFDKGLAVSLGFAPGIIHYMLMSLVSVTTVGAFDAVGAILVVAFIIVPASTAYLLTTDLIEMIIYSVFIGANSALLGYSLARGLDASIAGSITTVLGMFFFLAFLFSKDRGLIAVKSRRKRQKIEFNQMTLAVHLYHHSNESSYLEESRLDHFNKHFNWTEEATKVTLRESKDKDLIYVEEGLIYLTEKGKRFARESLKMLQFKEKNKKSEFMNDFIIFKD